MSTIQRAVVLYTSLESTFLIGDPDYDKKAVGDLPKLLADGWRVVSQSAAGGGSNGFEVVFLCNT